MGFRAATPQKAAGRSVEPVVWLPSAAGTIPAPTAAADPLLEPPGLLSRFQGFRVIEGSPLANWVVTVLPSATAPASLSRPVQAASSSGT